MSARIITAPTVSSGSVLCIDVLTVGDHYDKQPFVTIGPPDQVGGVQATAVAFPSLVGGGLDPHWSGGSYYSSKVRSILVTNPGSGYTTPPVVTITANVAAGDITGGGATASSRLAQGNLILMGDGAGYNYAIRRLPVAPAETDMIVFFFKGFYDKPWDNADNVDSGAVPGWDCRSCFGLSFTGTPPINNSLQNFYGYIASSLSEINFATSALYSGFSLTGLRPATSVFYKGASNGVAMTNTPGEQAALLPTCYADSQLFTGVWVVKKDTYGQNIIKSFGINNEGLTMSNISNALNSPNTHWFLKDDNEAEATNWRPDINTFNVPQYLIAKFCGQTSGFKFILNGFKIDYWNFNSGTIIGSAT